MLTGLIIAGGAAVQYGLALAAEQERNQRISYTHLSGSQPDVVDFSSWHAFYTTGRGGRGRAAAQGGGCWLATSMRHAACTFGALQNQALNRVEQQSMNTCFHCLCLAAFHVTKLRAIAAVAGLAVVALNWVVTLAVRRLTAWERWHTRTSSERFAGTKLALSYLLNSFAVPLLAAYLSGNTHSWCEGQGLCVHGLPGQRMPPPHWHKMMMLGPAPLGVLTFCTPALHFAQVLPGRPPGVCFLHAGRQRGTAAAGHPHPPA